jgi:glycerol dehydrogenase-like iron-containing ADH family enzyme
LTLLQLSSISQTSNDSSLISIPSYQLKKAINLIEKGKVMEQELNLSNQKILLLDESMKKKDLIISEYSTKDSISQRVINSYKSMVVNLESSLANAKSINTIDKIRNRKQKLKKWYTLVIGVGIGYLIAK